MVLARLIQDGRLFQGREPVLEADSNGHTGFERYLDEHSAEEDFAHLAVSPCENKFCYVIRDESKGSIIPS
jgi:hypothetical protein